MKLQDILNERGTWGIYGYRANVNDDKPKPIKDTDQDLSIAERVSEEIINNYLNLLDKKHIKRVHLQMIIGKVCRHMPQHQLPEFDTVAEYIRKKHRIKVK